MKLNVAKEISEHAEGSAAWESERSGGGVELRRRDFRVGSAVRKKDQNAKQTE